MLWSHGRNGIKAYHPDRVLSVGERLLQRCGGRWAICSIDGRFTSSEAHTILPDCASCGKGFGGPRALRVLPAWTLFARLSVRGNLFSLT